MQRNSMTSRHGDELRAFNEQIFADGQSALAGDASVYDGTRPNDDFLPSYADSQSASATRQQAPFGPSYPSARTSTRTAANLAPPPPGSNGAVPSSGRPTTSRRISERVMSALRSPAAERYAKVMAARPPPDYTAEPISKELARQREWYGKGLHALPCKPTVGAPASF
jgi:hypothetical protein